MCYVPALAERRTNRKRGRGDIGFRPGMLIVILEAQERSIVSRVTRQG